MDAFGAAPWIRSIDLEDDDRLVIALGLSAGEAPDVHEQLIQELRRRQAHGATPLYQLRYAIKAKELTFLIERFNNAVRKEDDVVSRGKIDIDRPVYALGRHTERVGDYLEFLYLVAGGAEQIGVGSPSVGQG